MGAGWLVWWNWPSRGLMFRTCLAWVLGSRDPARTACRPGPWVPYTRPLLSTEAPWGDQYSSYALRQRSIGLCIRMLYPWAVSMGCIHGLGGPLWSWPPHRRSSYGLEDHCGRDLRTEYPILLDPYQPALKTWKPPSWVTQEKHGLVAQLPAASSIEGLASYNPRPRYGDWQLTEWQWDLNPSQSIPSYLPALYTEVDEMTEEGGGVYRHRNLLDFLHPLHLTSTSITLDVQLDRAAASGGASGTVQPSMRRKP